MWSNENNCCPICLPPSIETNIGHAAPPVAKHSPFSAPSNSSNLRHLSMIPGLAVYLLHLYTYLHCSFLVKEQHCVCLHIFFLHNFLGNTWGKRSKVVDRPSVFATLQPSPMPRTANEVAKFPFVCTQGVAQKRFRFINHPFATVVLDCLA